MAPMVHQRLENARIFQSVLQDSLFDSCKDQTDVSGICGLRETNELSAIA